MAYYEIYAGKRVVRIISEILRHEYMWSNHSLTEESVGWGITASSSPEDKRRLKELEKLAAVMPVSSEQAGITEGLLYGHDCGFASMLAKPCAFGEDGRRNKRVQIFENPGYDLEVPETYLSHYNWVDEEASEGLLDTFDQEFKQIPVKKLMEDLGLSDCYISLFRSMMKALLEQTDGLNLVIPGLSGDQLGLYANQLMLLFHKFLPSSLRKRAGYISGAQEELHSVSFYFSDKVCGKFHLELETLDDSKLSEIVESPLEQYYLERLSIHFLEEDELFRAYEATASDYIREHENDAGLYSKIQWIYYILDCQNHGDTLDCNYLKKHIPELLYWGSKDTVFEQIGDIVLGTIHQGPELTEEDAAEYIRILLEGLSSRSRRELSQEIHWVLSSQWAKNPKGCRSLLKQIQDKNPSLYTELMINHCEDADSYALGWISKEATDLDGLWKLVEPVSNEFLTKTGNDIVFTQGIAFLNQDVFAKNAYKIMDQIVSHLHRRKHWIAILKNLLDQMISQVDYLSEDELSCACYVEKLYNHYIRSGKSEVLLTEQKKRNELQERELVMSLHDNTEKEKEEYEMTREPSYEELEEERGHNMSFPSYLMLSIPYGFFTGCALFLGKYSLMIGHWKIGIGMAGMLLLLFMMYAYTLIEKDTGYALWKSIGWCLVLGVLIELIMSTKLLKPHLLLIFLILGIVCLIIQAYNLWKVSREKNE